jgi:hypothetical protein
VSVHGMIEEKFRQAVADALAPLIERLEAVEQRLQQGSEPATTEPDQSLSPVQYASGGFIAGSRATSAEESASHVVSSYGDAAEPLPEEDGPEPEQPAKPPRKRPSRAKSTSVPEA